MDHRKWREKRSWSKIGWLIVWCRECRRTSSWFWRRKGRSRTSRRSRRPWLESSLRSKGTLPELVAFPQPSPLHRTPKPNTYRLLTGPLYGWSRMETDFANMKLQFLNDEIWEVVGIYKEIWRKERKGKVTGLEGIRKTLFISRRFQNALDLFLWGVGLVNAVTTSPLHVSHNR